MNIQPLLVQIARFPWRSATRTLGERLREDRLGLSAGSLTFTTTIALVPFFTVVLALFTAFPVFGKLQGAVQAWLVQSLVPDAISRQVLGYLTQFAGKASRLGAVGLVLLFITAFSLVLTIDRTLNGIWRVRRSRPLAQQVLVYWAVLTLGPLLLAASLSLSSYLVSASRGLVVGVPAVLRVLLDVGEFFLLVAGLAALYRFVPNTPVRSAHAWSGGLFAALGIEIARRLLAAYISAVPAYSAVYGAFATVPILLVWIYLGWLVILLGAVLVAYLPSLTAGLTRRETGPGWQFELALDALRALVAAQDTPRRGLSLVELSQRLGVTDLQLEPVLQTLVTLDWVARLDDAGPGELARYVLLADLPSTALDPLVRALLLPASDSTARLWQSGRLSGLTLKEAL
jgi:membrane protein